jgi:hypothetical protein
LVLTPNFWRQTQRCSRTAQETLALDKAFVLIDGAPGTQTAYPQIVEKMVEKIVHNESSPTCPVAGASQAENLDWALSHPAEPAQKTAQTTRLGKR